MFLVFFNRITIIVKSSNSRSVHFSGAQRIRHT